MKPRLKVYSVANKMLLVNININVNIKQINMNMKINTKQTAIKQ